MERLTPIALVASCLVLVALVVPHPASATVEKHACGAASGEGVATPLPGNAPCGGINIKPAVLPDGPAATCAAPPRGLPVHFLHDGIAWNLHCATVATGAVYASYRTSDHATWQQGRLAALSIGGHLATIASESENALVYSVLQGINRADIGFTDEASEGVWRWVTSEPTTFLKWAAGEPNNSYPPVGEDGAEMYGSTEPQTHQRAYWNDLGVTARSPRSIVVEHGIGAAAVPPLH